jgi:hypothetical protein
MPKLAFDRCGPLSGDRILRNFPIVHKGWRGDILTEPFRNSKLSGDVYQFGVATGYSMQVIGYILNDIRSDLHPRFFGFDVFTGMPVEANEPEFQLDTPGSFQLLTYVSASTFNEALTILQDDIKSNLKTNSELVIVPGLVESTLNNELISTHNLRPAFYIDMDMDIYSPTKHTLQFFCRNKLIVPGTLIGFDDWGQNYPTKPTYSCGESRAFKETVEEFGLTYETIETTHNNAQTLVRITKIG